MRKNSIKNTRVNTEVQRELSNIIRAGIKDPRVAPWTSVVAVQVAPDLKTCKAYISVLGESCRNSSRSDSRIISESWSAVMPLRKISLVIRFEFG